MEIIKTYESKISHSGLMRLMSGVVRINRTLYDFCGVCGVFSWAGEMFFLKGLISTDSRILIFVKMQLDER